MIRNGLMTPQTAQKLEGLPISTQPGSDLLRTSGDVHYKLIRTIKSKTINGKGRVVIMEKYFQMKAENNVAQIDIFGDIVSDKWYDEETSAVSFRDSLKSLGDVSTINLSINSGGGSGSE